MLLTLRRLLGLYVFAGCSEHTASKCSAAGNVDPPRGSGQYPSYGQTACYTNSTCNQSSLLNRFHASSSYDVIEGSVAHDLA